MAKSTKELGRVSAIIRRLQSTVLAGPASAVFYGMTTLALGNMAARIIGILAIPILTRIYTPVDFGVLAVFSSLVFMLSPFGTLRYILALPLPRREGTAVNLLALSFGLLMLVSLAIGLALLFFGQSLLKLFSMEMLYPYWWLILIGVLGRGGYEMLTLWATRKRDYKIIARTSALQSLLGNLTKITLGLLSFGPFGLLIGQVVSNSAGIGSQWVRFKDDIKKQKRFINARRIKKLLVRYRHFPLYRLPSQVILIFCLQAPLLFSAIHYNAEVVGQLGLALMAVSLPMNFFGQTTSKAYFAEVAKIGKRNPAQLRAITQSVMKMLFAISVVPATTLYFGGEWAFELLFGNEWSTAGEFASVLSVYLMAQFVSSPLTRIFSVLDMEQMFLVVNLQRLILVLCVFTPPFFIDLEVRDLLVVYSALLSLHMGAVCMYVLITLHRYNRKLDRA